jgi:RNA polymerase sigma factor (sigma-70 family)
MIEEAGMRPTRKLLQWVLGQGYATLSDCELVARIRSTRDETAFTILVQRHGPMVLGVCRRVVHDADEAEDALQDTFLELFRKADSIPSPENFPAWLHTVAHRTAIRSLEAKVRRQRMNRELALRPSRGEAEACPVEQAELRTVIDEELQQIPEIYRVPIILCRLEGQSGKQAAEALKVTEVALRSRLHRGMEMLKERLAKRGLGHLEADRAIGPCSLPVPLLQGTVKAAMAGGASTTGLLLAGVSPLAESVARKVLLARLKLPAAAFLLSLVAIVAGTCLVGQTRSPAGGEDAVGEQQLEEPLPDEAARQADEAPEPWKRDREAAEWVLRAGGSATVRPGASARPRVVRKLVDLPRQPFQLTEVTLDNVKSVRPEDLARFSNLANFTDLHVRASLLNRAGLSALRGCGSLRLICCDFNNLKDEDLDDVARLPAQRVSLRGNAITDEGLRRLRQAVHFTELNLSENNIDGRGLVHLGGMTRLTNLYLRKTRVRGSGLEHLPRLPALEELWLPERALGTIEDGADSLRRLPGLRAVAVCSDSVSEDERKLLRGVMAQAKQRGRGKVLVVWRIPLSSAELRRVRALLPSFTLRYYR